MQDNLKELQAKRIWVLWRKVIRDGHTTKMPISSTGLSTGTSAEYARTWVTYEEAVEASRQVSCSGIGFVIPKGYFFLDIDDVDLEDAFVKNIIKRFDSYAERSISGNGLHIYGSCNFNELPTYVDEAGNLKLAREYYTKNPHNKMELYIGGLTNRFAVFSEDAIHNAPLKDCTSAILTTLENDMRRSNNESKPATISAATVNAAAAPIQSNYTKDDAFDIICSLRAQKNGEKFIKLFDDGDFSDYNSQSEADMALCNLIAFRAGPNPELIDELFRMSALYRSKWERDDYRNNTIESAIRTLDGKFYADGEHVPEFVIFDAKHRPRVHAALLAKCFKDHVPMLLVRDNGKQGTLIYIYENGVYNLQSPDMLKGRIKKLITDFDEMLLKMHDVNEAFSIVTTDVEAFAQDELNANESIINFRNGLLTVENDHVALMPHSHEELSTIQIPCEWTGESSPTPVFDMYLDKLTNGDAEVKELLLEFIGVCLSNIKGWRMKKALFLVGDGDTGKSQLKALTEMLLGKGNFIGIDLKEIEARFGTGAIYGTRLAGSSDMSFMSISELKTFKKVTGGDSLFAEFKGQQGFEYTYGGLLWFCMNQLPKFGGDDGMWVYNRIMVVNCPNVVPVDKQDKALLDKMYAERDGIVYKAVKALQNVLKRGYNFIEPRAIVDAREEYREDNSSVITFFNECMCKVYGGKIKDQPTTARVYQTYKAWCTDNNRGYAKTAKEFRDELATYHKTTFKEMTTMINGYAYYKSITLTDVIKEEIVGFGNSDFVEIDTDNELPSFLQ